MKKALIILAIVAVIGFTAFTFYKKQFDKLIDMDYEFMAVQLESASLDNTVANVKIKLISDSTLEAVIKDLDLDIYIDGVYVGNITENKEILIPAKGYSIVDFHIKADVTEVKTNALNLIGKIWINKDAILTLKGKAKIKFAFLNIPVPVDYTESVKYLLS